MRRVLIVLGLLAVAACTPIKPPVEEPPLVPCEGSPSVSTSLRPDNLLEFNGATPSAGTIVDCVADDSDSTFVDVDQNEHFVVGFPELPAGAVSWSSATVHVRAARPSGANNTNLSVRVADYSSLENYLDNVTLNVGTTAADFSIPLTSVPTTAADIADLAVVIVGGGAAVSNFQVYRLELVIEADTGWSVGMIPVGF